MAEKTMTKQPLEILIDKLRKLERKDILKVNWEYSIGDKVTVFFRDGKPKGYYPEDMETEKKYIERIVADLDGARPKTTKKATRKTTRK